MLYTTQDGCYFSENDVMKAFHILIGEINDGAFKHWMEYMQKSGKLIKRKEGDCPIKDVAKSNWALAVRIYKNQTGCSIKEAKDYILYILEKEREKVYD